MNKIMFPWLLHRRLIEVDLKLCVMIASTMRYRCFFLLEVWYTFSTWKHVKSQEPHQQLTIKALHCGELFFRSGFILKQKVTNAVGKLDIVWRTAFGERGRLQTSQLQRVVSILCSCRALTSTRWIVASPSMQWFYLSERAAQD